jgi:hypothetical protein
MCYFLTSLYRLNIKRRAQHTGDISRLSRQMERTW